MRIFISYAKEDLLLCDTFERELKAVRGVVVIRDISQSEPGTHLPSRIKEQIDSCDLFAVLLTENSLKSKWVQMEIDRARDVGKHIVPIREVGVELSEIPSLEDKWEYISYDPTRYQETVKQLKEFLAREIKKEGSHNDSLPHQKPIGKGLISLSEEEISTLVLARSADIVPVIERQLIESARNTIVTFLTDPKHGRFVNLGTLSTDAKVVIIRPGTLHALLRAARHGSGPAFRHAGYEAGTLYGIGVVKWFLERTKEVYGTTGLPEDSFVLLKTCVQIDRTSGWGQIELADPVVSTADLGWSSTLSISQDFLSLEASESRFKEPKDRYKAYSDFWQGYLEATFTSALLSWCGEWMSKRKEFMLLVAECRKSEDASTPTHLVFDIRVHAPRYAKTCRNLERELFRPYVYGNNKLVVRDARGVVEGFVRELADAPGHPRENIKDALTWLAHDGPNKARGAASTLQKVRNTLHEVVHELAEPSEQETQEILCSTTAAILMACRDIEIDEVTRENIKQALVPPAT